MSWIYLIIAGFFEIGWPLGLKLSESTPNKFIWCMVAIISIFFSGFFLLIAQKSISMGTAYAVWTGIGCVGAFIVGIIVFKEPINFLRSVSLFFIVAGIIGMKLSHN